MHHMAENDCKDWWRPEESLPSSIQDFVAYRKQSVTLYSNSTALLCRKVLLFFIIHVKIISFSVREDLPDLLSLSSVEKLNNLGSGDVDITYSLQQWAAAQLSRTQGARR